MSEEEKDCSWFLTTTEVKIIIWIYFWWLFIQLFQFDPTEQLKQDQDNLPNETQTTNWTRPKRPTKQDPHSWLNET